MGNPKHFYLYLHHQGKAGIEFYWITRNKKLFRRLRRGHYPVLFLYSLKGIWFILRAGLLIIEQSAQDITGRTFLAGKYKIINTWHATAVKKIGFPEKCKNLGERLLQHFLLREYRLYEYYLSQSESCREIINQAFPNHTCLLLGYPRTDIFFEKERAFNDYQSELGLSDYRSVIVYAPTFRDGQTQIRPFSNHFLEQLNDFVRQQRALFLIKNHPLFTTKIDSDYFSNILDVSDRIDDLNELLIHTDILVSDYSSSVIEYALFHKPIIFYPFDYKEYLRSRGFSLDYYHDLPGPFAKSETELLQLLKTTETWFKQKEYQGKFQAFKRRFCYYQDGKSSERLWKFIKEEYF